MNQKNLVFAFAMQVIDIDLWRGIEWLPTNSFNSRGVQIRENNFDDFERLVSSLMPLVLTLTK